jgi:hypothetical protein
LRNESKNQDQSDDGKGRRPGSGVALRQAVGDGRVERDEQQGQEVNAADGGDLGELEVV